MHSSTSNAVRQIGGRGTGSGCSVTVALYGRAPTVRLHRPAGCSARHLHRSATQVQAFGGGRGRGRRRWLGPYSGHRSQEVLMSQPPSDPRGEHAQFVPSYSTPGSHPGHQPVGGPVPPPGGPVPPTEPRKRSWFARHKILTALLAVVALVIAIQVFSGGSRSEEHTSELQS